MNRTLMSLGVFLIYFAATHPMQGKTAQKALTYYRDVLPLLQQHCQVCHRAGGIAPMAFETY